MSEEKATGQEDEMLKGFSISQQRNEIAEVLRELFDEKKIFMITDISKDEAKLITRIQLVADMKGIEEWKDGTKLLAKLLLSKNRLSRKELLEAMKGQAVRQSLMSKLNPMNWSNSRRGGM